MKEVKFRGWSKTQEEMLSFGELILLQTELIQDGMEGYTFLEDCDLDIMQYTGLEDSEGQEIYEGDILAVNDSVKKYLVKNHDYTGGYNLETLDGIPAGLLNKEKSDMTEVVGNIYDNPELLEEAK